MLDSSFVYGAAVIIACGHLSYLIATVKGRVRPNRVTWLLWGSTPAIACAAEIDEGVGIQALMTMVVGVGPAAIFVASYVNPQAYWHVRRLDISCGILSLLGLALWLATQSGSLAIVFIIATDVLAAVPTVLKAYRHPRTEMAWSFWAAATGAAITLLTIDHWDFAHYGFPAYIFAIAGVLAVLITFRIGERLSGRSRLFPHSVPVRRPRRWQPLGVPRVAGRGR